MTEDQEQHGNGILQVAAFQVHPVKEKHEQGEMGYPNPLCFGACNSRKRIQGTKCHTIQDSMGELQKICHYVRQEESCPVHPIHLFSLGKEPLNQGLSVPKEPELSCPMFGFSCL